MSSSSLPRVSIVIPHFNRPERLIRTLQTVAEQTFTDWEVVIVDDASSVPIDDLDQLALVDQRIRIVRLAQNVGPASARNAGVRASRGTLIAFLDSDDEWRPDKLEKQVSVFEQSKNPDQLIVTTCIKKIGPKSVIVEPSRAVEIGETHSEYLFLNDGAIQASSLMLSRRAATLVQFDEGLRQFEDYLYFVRAGGAGLGHILVKEPLVTWYNDVRPDRLSRSSYRNMAAADRFLEAAGSLMDRRSRMVFLSRHVGPNHIRSRPFRAFWLLTRAVVEKLITPRLALAVAARGVLPNAVFTILRRNGPAG